MTCEIRAKVPEGTILNLLNALNPYCHQASPWLTQFRGLASYTIPKVDVLVSSVYQDKPGSPGIDASVLANYTLTATDLANAQSQLGRPLSGVPPFTVNLVAPRTLYGDRIRQLDFGAKKIVHVARTRTTLGVDLFNMLNSNVTLTYNNAFVARGAWLTPIEIMTARVARVNAEFSW